MGRTLRVGVGGDRIVGPTTNERTGRVRTCRPRPMSNRARWGDPRCLELIRDRLADILEIEPSQIQEGDSFADDLDADSLALIELVEALEEELSERSVGFRIEDEDLEDLKSVRDAVDYVVARLG